MQGLWENANKRRGWPALLLSDPSGQLLGGGAGGVLICQEQRGKNRIPEPIHHLVGASGIPPRNKREAPGSGRGRRTMFL